MSMPANDNESLIADPDKTSPMDMGESQQLKQGQAKQGRPLRELSQASIASFFYGTLQLLTTSIGAAILIPLMGLMKAFQVYVPTNPNASPPSVPAPVTGVNLEEMQKMIEELGITDPSGTSPVIPQTTTPPDVATSPSIIPGMPALPNLSSPEQIVPFEILAILLLNSFGFMGIVTAIVAFRAVSKGKSGVGLAVTGLMSSLISFGIAFYAAYTI